MYARVCVCEIEREKDQWTQMEFRFAVIQSSFDKLILVLVLNRIRNEYTRVQWSINIRIRIEMRTNLS